MMSAIEHQVVIVLDTWFDKFYFAVPCDPVPKPTSPPGSVISIDPGVRTPWVGYDPSGKVIDFAPLSRPEIQRLHRGVDAIKARLAKKEGTRGHRTRLVNAIRRRIARVGNLVLETQRQTAHYLCTRYETILLPDLKLSTWLPKKFKKMNHVVRRGMLAWRHYAFKQRLTSKAIECGCRVLIVNEAYTSKTCGHCGKLNDTIGGSKVFSCSCGHIADRDHNAARNILLRYLTLNGL